MRVSSFFKEKELASGFSKEKRRESRAGGGGTTSPGRRGTRKMEQHMHDPFLD